MIRISKLTDYGIVLLTYFAVEPKASVLTAKELAKLAALPLPTVGKILKTLCRGELLVSLRGIRGGYRLARSPDHISIADIVSVLEGPISLTECSAHSPGLCEFESACPVKTNWEIINETVRKSLSGLTLTQMARPLPKRNNVAQLISIAARRKA